MSKIYKIKKGNHSSGIHLNLHCGKFHEFKNISFSEECWYPYLNTDSYDINKLFGFSHGHHHINSIRFGWVPNFEKKNYIEIWIYIYNKGVRKFEKICEVSTNKWYRYQIYLTNHNEIIFLVKDLKNNILIGNSTKEYKKPTIDIGYNLFPFFGGNNASPCDMEITFS